MVTEVQEVSKIEEIRAKLTDINSLIAPYQLAYVSPVDDCIALEQNAHYMEKDILDKLTSNVAEDGFLSQLPFCMKRAEDGKYLVLSGNHRLKASIKANLPYILVLYIDEVSKDKQIAYQLSHNSLVGKDDIQMLKEIYSQIQSIEAKEFTGLNGMNFMDINKINLPSIGDGDIELKEMKFLFVESKANKINDILDVLESMEISEETRIVVGSFEAFIKVMQEVKKVFQVKSKSLAFSKMVDICAAFVEEKKKEEEEAAKAVIDKQDKEKEQKS